MVATRRTRVGSPVKDTSDEPESGQEPPSTIRRTRKGTVIVTGQANDSQQDKALDESTPPAKPISSPKRATRSSRRRPTEKQPDSTHEADVSESESCYSEVSDVQAVVKVQQTPRRATRRSTVAEKQEACEVEGPSAAVSTQCRSTRAQKKPSSVLRKSRTTQEDDNSEAESCSSIASLSKVLDARMQTRSSRKLPLPTEDAEVDSCSSTTSGPQSSTVRRSTRSSSKSIKPIPIHFDQSETPKPSSRRQKGDTKSISEDQAYESDGCQSGPSLSPLRTFHTGVCVDHSDSELSAVSMLHDGMTLGGHLTDSASGKVDVSNRGSVKVTLQKLYVPTVITKIEEENVKKGDIEMDKAEDAIDALSHSESEDLSDVEELENEAFNKTVIAADHSVSEDAHGDITLTLEEDETLGNTQEDNMQPERKQDSTTLRSMNMSNTKASKKQTEEETVRVLELQSSGSPKKYTKKVKVTEMDCSEHAEKPGQQCEGEHKGEDVFEDEEKTEELVVDEGIPAEEETSKGLEREELSDNQRKDSEKGVISLLDSSEDEESDDQLSDEEGYKQNDHDMDSEEVCFEENHPGPSETLDSSSSNGLFVVDTRPGLQSGKMYYIDASHEEDDNIGDSKAMEDEEDFVDEEGDEEEDEDSKVLFTTRKSAMPTLSTSIDPGLKLKDLGGLYISFDGNKSKTVSNNLKKLKEQKNQDELLKKSVISGDFEKKDAVPPYKESKHVAKIKRRAEREKTTGDGWFNMKAPELTEELKNDLKALKMRSALDPKRFYKKNDREGFPKYFQVGTVVDDPVDFYHSRIPKKERKRTIVEELLADAEFRRFNKRKFKEIMTEKAAEAAGKMKKHKFHKKK